MKIVEKICGNCLLYNHQKGECKVAVIIEGEKFNMPVSHKDACHLEKLDIPIQEVRWWVEDERGNPTDKNGTVKIEYPEGFFGK